MSFEAIVDGERRRTKDDGHLMITIAYHEPMAQVSLNHKNSTSL